MSGIVTTGHRCCASWLQLSALFGTYLTGARNARIDADHLRYGETVPRMRVHETGVLRRDAAADQTLHMPSGAASPRFVFHCFLLVMIRGLRVTRRNGCAASQTFRLHFRAADNACENGPQIFPLGPILVKYLGPVRT